MKKLKNKPEKYNVNVAVSYKPYLSLDIKFPKGKIPDTPKDRFFSGEVKRGVLSLGYCSPIGEDK